MSTPIELTYVSEPAQAMSFLGLMRLLYHSYSNNRIVLGRPNFLLVYAYPSFSLGYRHG
jgi:hypothetical protein